MLSASIDYNKQEEWSVARSNDERNMAMGVTQSTGLPGFAENNEQVQVFQHYR